MTRDKSLISKNKLLLASLLLLLPTQYSCNKSDLFEDGDIIHIETPDWAAETHEVRTYPDYDQVFPQEEVLKLNITIDSEYWQQLEDDPADNLGSGFSPFGGPGGGPGGPGETDFDPIWIPCSLVFEGVEWYQVGIRVKGNSSLRSTYNSGLKKFSFKLDFDEFEDNYPAIDNQRFYGFRQLNLNNNFEDKSFLREKVGSDLFREYGLVSARTAFAAIYIDYGEGEQYFGLYTLVEEVDDTVLDDQLGHSGGNLYKPEGSAATFAYGTYDESEMEKKNNEGDYTDVNALYTIINSNDRIDDNENWKSELESIFDVDEYIKWLAANTTMQNWDTYGKMNHNFLLYNNPDSNTIIWIPWDNNESLQEGKMGGALSLSLSEVGDDWPLIRYIIDENEYLELYHAHLEVFISETFTSTRMQNKYQTLADMIQEWVYLEESNFSFLNNDYEFNSAVETLKSHVQERSSSVLSYLNN